MIEIMKRDMMMYNFHSMEIIFNKLENTFQLFLQHHYDINKQNFFNLVKDQNIQRKWNHTYDILSYLVRLSIHRMKHKWIIGLKCFKKLILHMIWSHYMNFINKIWVIMTYWTFEVPKTQCHNPYHMIMDSLYLLKCLIEWLYI